MSHHVIEAAAAVTVAVALAVGVIVLPRPKPEPPQQEQRPPVETVAPAPAFDVDAPVTLDAEPRTPEQRQVDDVKMQVARLKEKADRLEKLLDEKAQAK
jgi:hypothetical protein